MALMSEKALAYFVICIIFVNAKRHT